MQQFAYLVPRDIICLMHSAYTALISASLAQILVVPV